MAYNGSSGNTATVSLTALMITALMVGAHGQEDTTVKHASSAHLNGTDAYHNGGGAQEEVAADTAITAHCMRRVLQWVVQLHDSSNVALLAGITTLGLVTMSVMVACGLAAWLCGVGLRTARGQGAPCNGRPAAEREDNRTHAGGPRTRNPQRKGYGAGMFVRSYADNCPDPILSEPPTLARRPGRYTRSDAPARRG